MLLFVCLSAIFPIVSPCIDLLFVVDSQDGKSVERSVKVANDVGHLGLFLSIATKRGNRYVTVVAKNKADLIRLIHIVEGPYSELLNVVTQEISRRKIERPLIVLLFTEMDISEDLMTFWKDMKNSTLHVFRVGTSKNKENIRKTGVRLGIPFEQLIACSRKFHTMDNIRRRDPSTSAVSGSDRSTQTALVDSRTTKRHPIFKGTTSTVTAKSYESLSKITTTVRPVPIRVRNRFDGKGFEQRNSSSKAQFGRKVQTKNDNPIPITSPSSKPPGCVADILFLVDFSRGTGEHSQNYFDIAASAVGVLPIGEDAVRVALIGYSGPGRATALFHFNKHDSKDDLIEELFRMQRHGGTTRTAEAIRSATKEFANARYGARSGAKRVIVLFTDGFSQDDPATAAEEARREGIMIVAVSVASRFKPNIEELIEITGKKELVLISPNGQQIRDKVFGKTCEIG